MSESLYRKCRPTTFDDVVEQKHITDTLKNQIENNKVGHAYLFAGSRGTGKTTCARIFARAINCLSPVNGSPCGKCDACRALENPTNLDILELDAASNNGVDDARDIRDKAKYLPVSCRYKVYIIDEVHMLTGGAFNALLKTIEEPPSHVVFILATTEPQKLPATVLSRCMRFDFKLVSTDGLTRLISSIYDKEKKKYEPAAVKMIAALGEGSVRDSLSIADMCLNYSDTLTLNDVMTLTGATDRSVIFDFLSALSDKNPAACFKLIDNCAKKSRSMQMIAKETAKAARDIAVIKALGVKDATESALVVDGDNNVKAMNDLAQKMSTDFLLAIIEKFSALDQTLRYGCDPRVALEAAALAACEKSSILSRLEAIENDLKKNDNLASEQNASADNAQYAADENNASADNARYAADEQNASADNARYAADENNASADNARFAADENNASADNAQYAADEQNASADNARYAADEQNASADNARYAADEQNASVDNARYAADENNASADNARYAADEQNASADNAKTSTSDIKNNESTANVSANKTVIETPQKKTVVSDKAKTVENAPINDKSETANEARDGKENQETQKVTAPALSDTRLFGKLITALRREGDSHLSTVVAECSFASRVDRVELVASENYLEVEGGRARIEAALSEIGETRPLSIIKFSSQSRAETAEKIRKLFGDSQTEIIGLDD